MRKVKIYKLLDPITKEVKYVGKTIQKLNERLKSHLNPNNKDFTYRANWIRKLKTENLKPIIELIEECNDENWVEREIYWINEYSKITTLTNYSKGGNGGHYVNISTKEKLSIITKEKWVNEEYRNKMIDITKNLWSDEKHKEKMSSIAKEKWLNEEYRIKMSNMSKKLWENENYRKNRLNDEAKEKIRQSRLNSNLSEETKNKISEKSKQNWQDEKFKDKMKKHHDSFKKVVIIDEIEYPSMKEASMILKIDSSTISRRVNSDKHPNYILK
jgi:hypothetical protein